MTTYLIKQLRGPDQLTASDLAAFVDGAGRLELRVEGTAAHQPFEIARRLRAAGFGSVRTWVENGPATGVDPAPARLRVTARTTPAEAEPTAPSREPVRRPVTAAPVAPAAASHWALGFTAQLVGAASSERR